MDRLLPLFLIGALLSLSLSLKAQPLVSADSVDHYTESEMSNMGLNPENSVTVYRITYLTAELDSSIDTASGALLVPDVNDCSGGYPLLSYQHGTVLKDSNVPSQNGSLRIGLFYSSDAYVTCMPDHLGLGSHEGLHPYHHARTEATSALDLMRAVREFFRGSGPLALNGQVFLSGYSQGGHSTMALHQYIETRSLLDSFDVKVSTPLSGAYDLSGVQSELPSDSNYGTPGYYPYIIESYQNAYGNLYDSIEEYYDAPYDSLVPIYLAGDSTLQDFNDALPNNLYHFMEDSVLDAFYADSTRPYSHPLRIALYKNDLYRWGPERRTRVFYCGSDEQVFPGNSKVAEDSMSAYGAQDLYVENVNDLLGHGGCIFPALDASKSAFDSVRVQCVSTSIPPPEETRKELEVRERSGGRKKVLTPFQKPYYQVWSMQGKLLMEGEAKGSGIALDTEEFSKGVYVIRVFSREKGHALQKRFIVR